MRHTLTRDFYIVKGSTPVTREGINTIVYTYDSAMERPCAMAFAGKAQKPAWHFIFKSNESREQYIDRYFESLEKWAKHREDAKVRNQQGAEVFSSTIRQGDYFYTSWGYDQTNIDYLVVVSVSPSRKTVLCRMADAINLGPCGQQDELLPGTAYGEPFRLHVRDGCLVGQYPFCNGSTRDGYFSRTQFGQTHMETNLMFGH